MKSNLKKIISNKLSFLALFMLITIIFTGYGYAAFNTTLTISGESHVRPPDDIRITNVRKVSSTNSGYETYKSEYSKYATSMFVTLPQYSSTITYEVTITNSSSERYYLSDLVATNSNSATSYSLQGLAKGDVIDKNETKTFAVTIQTNGTANQVSSLLLKYTFEKYVITASMLDYDNPDGTSCQDAQCGIDEVAEEMMS